ncbi:MAG: hypothetical protein IS632_08615 [Thaumarchaeota archaeon]|nr:hypothetical protein [Nitrososphaerota archaeon]
MTGSWVRRRWLDFRMGHSIYLIFLMSFANFMLIFHRLLIERVEWLNNLLGELWVFGILFVFLYVPVAIIVGAWHRKTQIKVETEIQMLQSPLHAKIFRIMIDIQTGKATPDEIEALRNILKGVEDKAK